MAACREVGKHPDAHFECPYVVRLQNVNYLADSQPVFVFDHPNYTAPVDNERYIKLDFTAQHSSMVHGVAGFFDMVNKMFFLNFDNDTPMHALKNCEILSYLERLKRSVSPTRLKSF